MMIETDNLRLLRVRLSQGYDALPGAIPGDGKGLELIDQAADEIERLRKIVADYEEAYGGAAVTKSGK